MNNLTPFLETSLTEVCLFNPRSFIEAENAISRLKAGQLLLVNLAHLSFESSQRIIDYLSGSTHALGGKLTQVGNGVYLFSPPNIPTQKISSLSSEN
ncbi:cell division protein SepF [Acaryochloris marina NIES-2412]|uniref:cell division protein SepF n=1 Tax=Acaryochloris marina TaxID=155978 RepID=UPI004058C58C